MMQNALFFNTIEIIIVSNYKNISNFKENTTQVKN